MKIVVLILLILFSLQVFGQNYIEYQKTFNQIDDDVEHEDFPLALKRLDSIFENYDFIFARHCIKALQISCKANDSLRAERFLSKCFVQGIPLWVLRSNELTNKALQYTNIQQTVQNSDSLYAVYKSNIDISLRSKLDSLLIIDQKFTKKVNQGFILFRYTLYNVQWKRNNKKQFEIIHKIIEEYGFPGEKLAGLPPSLEDSTISAKNIVFYGPNIFDYRAYIMLIHFFSNPAKDINPLLFENVISGNLPAEHFGAINDFMAKWGKGKYGNYFYYNVWHQDPEKQVERINERRSLIGLNSFEQQRKNMIKNRESRKNNSIATEIIRE